MAGLIKVLLSLQHNAIPASLHCKSPTPQFNWQNQPLKVPQQLTPWSPSNQPRTAGVSAFGFNGTNAHLIVAEAPHSPIPQPPTLPYHLLTLSARNASALQQLIHCYLNYLKQPHPAAIGDLCWTANSGRTHFSHRLAIRVSSLSELCTHLEAFRQGSIPEGVMQGEGNNSNTVIVQWTHEQIQISGPMIPERELPLTSPPEQWLSVLQSLAEQYVAGTSIQWTWTGSPPYQKVELPTYPFQHQHYGL